MEEVEIVVAHQARATLRVGEVFLKIDVDQARTDVEAPCSDCAWSDRDRWLVEHDFDPASPGCEVDMLRRQR